MNEYYILEGHDAKPVANVIEWAQWYEKANRVVQQDNIGEVKVSTVFLGLNHAFEAGLPLLFETMVFGGAHDMDMERYSTWDEAVKGHQSFCELVKKSAQ